MTILLIAVAFASLLSGVIVWLRNPRQDVYRSYLMLCASGALWIMTNLVFDGLRGHAQYIDALISYGSVGLFATFFVSFAAALTLRKQYISSLKLLGVLLTILFSMPQVLATAVIDNAIQTTWVIWIYALWLLFYYVLGMYFLVRGRNVVSRVRRKQIDAVIKGLIVTLCGATIFNLVLPLTGNYSYILLGPAFSSVFIGTFAYSIWHYGLFDIRRTLARFFAYILSVAALGAGVGYGAYFIAGTVSDHSTPVLYFVGVGVFVAIIFSYVKKFFDYVTKKVFLSGQYDMQEAIDRMTAVFSASTTIPHLERATQRELSEIIGASSVTIEYSHNQKIGAYLRKSGKAVVVRDELVETNDDELYNEMDVREIAMLTPLVIDRRTIGYLCVGNKANGTSYTRHDIQFIDIISGEMAITLQNAQRLQEIQHFNEDLQTRVRDATSKLRFTNKKLRGLDATKDEFISMASHQLRTPLTSVKGYLSMVLEGDAGEINPQQRKLLEEAFTSSQRMVYLIGDFLNVSRIQTGKFELERSSVSLPAIISEEISQLTATAKSRGITLAYHAPTDFPVMCIDENKIRQVMMNFIDNAIYYSPENTTITVSLAKYDNRIEFKVSDQGIGVPKEAQSHLFTKFYRADNAKLQRPDGTGIGLFMAKKVIIEHGGAILFESNEGRGSMFGFRLPLETPKTPCD